MYVLNVSGDIKIMPVVEYIGFTIFSKFFATFPGLLKRNK